MLSVPAHIHSHRSFSYLCEITDPFQQREAWTSHTCLLHVSPSLSHFQLCYRPLQQPSEVEKKLFALVPVSNWISMSRVCNCVVLVEATGGERSLWCQSLMLSASRRLSWLISIGMKFNKTQRAWPINFNFNCTFKKKYMFCKHCTSRQTISFTTFVINRQRWQIVVHYRRILSLFDFHVCMNALLALLLRRRRARSPQLFFPLVWGHRAMEMVLYSSCFRASTRPQHVGPNNKNKHPGVELVPQCEDFNEEHVELPRHTVRGNQIPCSLFYLPLSVSLPPFSRSFFIFFPLP